MAMEAYERVQRRRKEYRKGGKRGQNVWSFGACWLSTLESCRLERSEEIPVFTDEFHYPTKFSPGDEVIGDSFQPFLIEVWRWPPHIPRYCEGALRGIRKCHANSTSTPCLC
ncbi:hypothetical protein AVEN_114191-1 [Araneus ventricosus]|uniref:Uncharacterized protein n=1 Tax=Araneus ventricosus TaxID=182803 RepID=A0A4Y2E195_ARAVE|nr:hypothetical protein AVEN_227849-1 [Araneus ventricosus]GBM22214.1 hypothetical protein AVEN_114191-1 [Araneus ventricosus]